MFNNPGKKLQTVAIIYFFLVVLVSLIFAFSFGFKDKASDFSCGAYTCSSKQTFLPIPFFAILIGGPVFGYLSALMLYGFGTLIESSERTKEQTTRLESIESALNNLKFEFSLTEENEQEE